MYYPLVVRSLLHFVLFKHIAADIQSELAKQTAIVGFISTFCSLKRFNF